MQFMSSPKGEAVEQEILFSIPDKHWAFILNTCKQNRIKGSHKKGKKRWRNEDQKDEFLYWSFFLFFFPFTIEPTLQFNLSLKAWPHCSQRVSFVTHVRRSHYQNTSPDTLCVPLNLPSALLRAPVTSLFLRLYMSGFSIGVRIV